ncbi:ESF1 isoform 1 [Schistosoma japonicum]|uniref:ESF1 isoform 1 n=1 Tax=Schistosoma japonicum TaxID=6182 RepID=A0A4Z2CWT6_SCHJA|nr:ESF1 isoform 1 [Schistosoma japonicum]
MNNKNLEEISQDPLLAPGKRKGARKTRTVKDLFGDVGPEAAFKDKRGRPWFKNPRAYVKQKLASKIQSDDVVKQSECTSSEDSDKEASEAESSSSLNDDDEVDVFEDIEDLQGADWYELTKDSVPATQTSHRLALLHFDWDNAKPETIYMVLESFLPARGHIEKVTIYPSEFGIQRMKEEAIHGPVELRPSESDTECNENTNNITEDNSTMAIDVDEKSGWRKASSKLRRRIREYQLARLKYFYAIIEFDSVETAEAIYSACDGLEYESSGSRLDLRFVDNDQRFEVAPEYAHLVSECREINKAKYTPLRFETTALHSTRIGITWDKTPADRTNWLRDQFRPDVDPQTTLTENRDELSKYLALSSSGASTTASSDPESEPPAPTVPRIHRHRPKRPPPAEVRLALLGLTSSKDDTVDLDENHNEDEEIEEVFDLAPNSSNGPSEISEEEYDLGPIEKKHSQRLSSLSSRKRKVRRKILPEARDSDEEEEETDENNNSLEPEDNINEKVIKSSSQGESKRKKKIKQRAKILEKKRKIQTRLERESKLWFGDNNSNELCEDDRFDEFLRNSAFEISQTHPDYKEAHDFLRYMKMRQSKSAL